MWGFRDTCSAANLRFSLRLNLILCLLFSSLVQNLSTDKDQKVITSLFCTCFCFHWRYWFIKGQTPVRQRMCLTPEPSLPLCAGETSQQTRNPFKSVTLVWKVGIFLCGTQRQQKKKNPKKHHFTFFPCTGFLAAFEVCGFQVLDLEWLKIRVIWEIKVGVILCHQEHFLKNRIGFDWEQAAL